MPGRTGKQDDAATRNALIATARALKSDGVNLSIALLSKETGISIAKIRRLFGTVEALLAAVKNSEMQTGPDGRSEGASAPMPATISDAWLERRLRVFERALATLETKAEATAREHGRTLALLQEKLSERPEPAPVVTPLVTPIETIAPAPQAPAPAAATTEKPSDLRQRPIAVETLSQYQPPQPVAIPHEEMTAILEKGRVAADPAAQAQARRTTHKSHGLPRSVLRTCIAVSAATLVVLLVCVGLTRGDTARATQIPGFGVSHRQLAAGFSRVMALADNGDANAQTQLALDYLRGVSVPADTAAAARWSRAAAAQGQPEAQYILGTLYASGDGVKADPGRAFQWFSLSAAHGNVKAMHNVAIAYIEGLGVAKDATAAAQWFARAASLGYRDSAFDLAVLYERGDGVAQSPKDALKWYETAASSGDAQAAQRATLLREQISGFAQRKNSTDTRHGRKTNES